MEIRVPPDKQLLPFQVKGVSELMTRKHNLLADEMGLGKTAQAIATAELMARLFGVERVLIVCPTSLKHQWKNGYFIARNFAINRYI